MSTVTTIKLSHLLTELRAIEQGRKIAVGRARTAAEKESARHRYQLRVNSVYKRRDAILEATT